MSIVKIEELVKPLSRMTNKEQFKQAAMRLKKAMVSNHIEKYFQRSRKNILALF